MNIEATKKESKNASSKRTAILAAARELFMRDGFERTSMDGIATRAEVSKRTVYDYFGDKRHLLLHVIEEASDALIESMRHALHEHLSDAAPIHDTASLEDALIAFSVQMGASLMNSSDYATVLKLIDAEQTYLLDLKEHSPDTEPEEAIAERLSYFAKRGLLEIPNPRLAADHFNALTVLLAYNNFAKASPEQIKQSMTDGVHVFMRAYVPRG